MRLLAVAAEENLSLIPLLESWAEDERGAQRWRIRRVISFLNQGRTLPDAVEAVPGVLREEDVLAIRFDAQSGTRTAAMRNSLRQQEGAAERPKLRVMRPIIYLCIVLPICLLLISILQTAVHPKLLRIFSEFGADDMSSIQLSTRLSSAFLGGGWLLVAVVLAALVWLFSTQRGRNLRRTLSGRLFRPAHAWHVADILQMIGLVSQAGRPVSGALSTLARYHFDPTVRQELLFVRNEIELGADLWQSMAAVGMLTEVDVRALRTAERIGNVPWVLDQLADVKRRRTSQRFRNWSEFVLPVIVLLLAVFVLLQALTVFEPLTRLIQDLA